MTEREESDQLPEEGPESQVPDDDGGGEDDVRSDAERNAGAAPGDDQDDEKGQATGNPGAAG